MSHAQTNLQLYQQAIGDCWDESSLASLKEAYEVAIKLFADAYRTSRRPFVAHLVGTASTLIAWRQSPVSATAGLLHSAYQ
jgi:(p)ppGpp synthase/HD superfamily hydrolase